MSITATTTDAGRNMIRDLLKGSATTTIKYIAIGTSATTPTTGDLKLGSEVWRKAVGTLTNGAAAGELLASIYIAAGDAVGVSIEEVGAFAGSSASSTPNSGTLVARALYHHPNKAITESILAQLDITI